jgi:hypothetical protein
VARLDRLVESGRGSSSSQGENSGLSVSSVSGGGVLSSVATDLFGKGRTSGSGSYASTAGDASVTSQGSDRSEGGTTTQWKDVALGGGSWGQGVMTTGGSQQGSSSSASQGSSASLSTSGYGSHDVSGGPALGTPLSIWV